MPRTGCRQTCVSLRATRAVLFVLSALLVAPSHRGWGYTLSASHTPSPPGALPATAPPPFPALQHIEHTPPSLLLLGRLASSLIPRFRVTLLRDAVTVPNDARSPH